MLTPKTQPHAYVCSIQLPCDSGHGNFFLLVEIRALRFVVKPQAWERNSGKFPKHSTVVCMCRVDYTLRRGRKEGETLRPENASSSMHRHLSHRLELRGPR